ncbi:Protein XRP2 [Chionoecetes opilio]|uniref:Protein XRP2 n=1 Tax=Chionoecetes opilio TaxID=41210 RepID=A0A8J4YJT8_CHIOP|nr:Protein XRP2 [Chionoecetes opilio]
MTCTARQIDELIEEQVEIVFVRDSRECVVVAACGQFRTRDCHRLEVFLLCQTQPIIEASTKMKFGCFQASYPQLKAISHSASNSIEVAQDNECVRGLVNNHFAKAGLSVFNNNWSNVYDFTPVEGETNWSTVTQPSALPRSLPLPRSQPLASVGLSVEEEDSVVPYTLGSPLYLGQETALVFLLHNSDQHQTATTLIAALRRQVADLLLHNPSQADCRIQYSREVKMEAVDAVRVFQGSEHKAAVSRGPVIALLCLGAGIHRACTSHVAGDAAAHLIPDSSLGLRQIDAFFSYASMSMTIFCQGISFLITGNTYMCRYPTKVDRPASPLEQIKPFQDGIDQRMGRVKIT